MDNGFIQLSAPPVPSFAPAQVTVLYLEAGTLEYDFFSKHAAGWDGEKYVCLPKCTLKEKGFNRDTGLVMLKVELNHLQVERYADWLGTQAGAMQ